MPSDPNKQLETIKAITEIAQPESLAHTALESDVKRSDLDHINNTFDVAYAAMTVARKTGEFCSIIKAIQTSIAMRRKILGYDSRSQGAKGSRKSVDLLG